MEANQNKVVKLHKQDYSEVCTHDDDHDEHCWGCIWFHFPIGCMKHEEGS